MRVAARRSGLSPHVIRVWERRYGAVEPARTETNRRLYSDGDVERLRLLHLATQAGHGIGQIANLPIERLQELVRQDGPAFPAAPAVNGAADAADIIAACMDCVRRLDAAGLEEQLARAAVDMSQHALMEQVIDPLMQGIGEAWQSGSLRVADEHVASAVVRAFLGGLQDLRRPPASGPGLVVTTLSGQVHEVGAMMVAASATAAGWRTIYLGPDLPAEEIVSAARRHNARAVALSFVYPTDDPRIPGELQRLRRSLDDDMEILAGGRASASYHAALAAIGAHRVADLADLRRTLSALAGGRASATGT
jgi:methanogenic corrinoid protein MtbC1